MIKRLRFATRNADLPLDDFTRRWPLLCAASAEAPGGLRPLRVAVCTILPDLTGPGPRHDGVVAEWFRDVGHLRRHDRWCATLVKAAEVTGDIVEVIAREHILRGEDWLEHRWDDGGDRLKHMAVAVRAAELSPAEFATRWKSHAGSVGGPGATSVRIPDAARGLAYVQNHPVESNPAAYDAVNEVYFDDVTGLRSRIDWFRSNFRIEPGDLFERSWFLAAREVVLTA